MKTSLADGRSARYQLAGGLRFVAAIAAIAWTALPRAAAAAPIKVACIGEHTTHSHAFPATNRETQPVGKQEYPAQLQTLLGTGYDVRNFGDCCSTVLQGYKVAETHPYINGTNAGDGVGYKESIAFLPDVVVIGSWGRHDWGLSKAPGQVFTLEGFQQGYEDLIQRYQNLASHPKIFASLPVPILNGQGDVPDNGVTTSSVAAVIRTVAAKYKLPIVDLYTPFLNHKELFKQPPDGEGEGEHVTDAGLTIIAKAVFDAMNAAPSEDGGTDASSNQVDASGGAAGAGGASATNGASGAAGSGGAAGAGPGVMVGQSGSENAAGSMSAQAGGAADETVSGNASDSGCSCAFATRHRSTGLVAAFALCGLLLIARRRR
jgi:GDSL-like Lipase/Acylhydrolase family